jgi:phage virion morphogenesis protein
MSGSAIIVAKLDAAPLDRWLDALSGKLSDLTPAFEVIGQAVVTSVQKNFEAEGRPAKWAPLSLTTLMKGAKRSKRGWITPKKRGKILQIQGWAGGLLGSIHYAASPDKVVIGTNKIYAAVQQFGQSKGASGADKFGRPIPWGDVPARPYLMVQDDDWQRIARDLKRYLAGREG